MVEDVFRPRSEPALSIYDAFQQEAKLRGVRSFEQWSAAEIDAVYRAAADSAANFGLNVPTLEMVMAAERYARGSADYALTWVCQLLRSMQKA